MRERKKERNRRERGISENRILNARTIKLIYASLSQVYCIYSLENALINFAIQSRFYTRNSLYWPPSNPNNPLKLPQPKQFYINKATHLLIRFKTNDGYKDLFYTCYYVIYDCRNKVFHPTVLNYFTIECILQFMHKDNFGIALEVFT